MVKSEDSCLVLVAGIFLSLVALGFRVTLRGGGWRKALAASRIPLWDPVNKESLAVAPKQHLPSSTPEGA